MTQYLPAVHHAGAFPALSPEETRRSFAGVAALATVADAGVLVLRRRPVRRPAVRGARVARPAP